MFKYLRNINNSNHPSELVTFPFEHNSEGSLNIKPGMIFTLSAGKITMVFVTDSPKFLVVKVSEEDSRYGFGSGHRHFTCAGPRI